MTNYYTEYKHYPEVGILNAEGDRIADTGPDSKLIDTLIGLDSNHNSRALSFFTARSAKSPSSPGLWVSIDSQQAHLLDAWGNPYQVIYDANYDGKVTVPGRTGAETMELFAGAAAWSDGPNGIPGPYESGKNDDIYSF